MTRAAGGLAEPMFPTGVYLLVILNFFVFVQEYMAPHSDVFVNSFALIPYDFSHNVTLAPPSPQSVWATLLTTQFLHASLLHITFNMFFLLVFGPDIEYLCGGLRFVTLYLLCGALGGIAEVAVSPGSHVPLVGASGAVAGVLGAYLISYPTSTLGSILPLQGARWVPRFVLAIPVTLVIVVWALSQFVQGYDTFSSPGAAQAGGTAYFAHIGGIVAGATLIGLFRVRALAPRRFRYYY